MGACTEGRKNVFVIVQFLDVQDSSLFLGKFKVETDMKSAVLKYCYIIVCKVWGPFFFFFFPLMSSIIKKMFPLNRDPLFNNIMQASSC